MAVEAQAHRLLLAGGGGHVRQQLAGAAAWPWTAGGADDAAFQFHQAQPGSCVGGVGLSPAAAPVARYAAAAGGQLFLGDAAESDVTFGGGGAAQQQQEVMPMAMATAMAPRKRKRAAEQAGQTPPPALGNAAAGVAAHFQNQLFDVDRLVLQHTAKMWAELTELRRRHARQAVAAVEAAAAKRLRAREEEIQRVGRLNWALEERVRGLYVEAQVWRDLAHSNEAAAAALRAELQQALDAQQHAAARFSGADDAGSCCRGENDGAGQEEEAGTPAPPAAARACAVCGEGAAEVVLLPCRHLCACAACAGAARACPACGCAKNGSVCVNFS